MSFMANLYLSDILFLDFWGESTYHSRQIILACFLHKMCNPSKCTCKSPVFVENGRFLMYKYNIHIFAYHRDLLHLKF